MGTSKQELEEDIRTVVAGKKEDTSKARIVVSSEPLPNEMLKIKKLYGVCLFAMLIGLVFTPLLAIGLMGAMLLCCIDDVIVKNKLNRLRRAKFKFVPRVGNDEVFQIMQPILVPKYSMLAERGEHGIISLTFQGYIYDILLEKDDTFTIWWHMSVGKAFLPRSRYKQYRQILAAMGIIAYEMQKAYNVQ